MQFWVEKAQINISEVVTLRKHWQLPEDARGRRTESTMSRKPTNLEKREGLRDTTVEKSHGFAWKWVFISLQDLMESLWWSTWKEKGKGQLKSSQDGAWDKKIRVTSQCTSEYNTLMVACSPEKTWANFSGGLEETSRRVPDAWEKTSEDKG